MYKCFATGIFCTVRYKSVEETKLKITQASTSYIQYAI